MNRRKLTNYHYSKESKHNKYYIYTYIYISKHYAKPIRDLFPKKKKNSLGIKNDYIKFIRNVILKILKKKKKFIGNVK